MRNSVIIVAGGSGTRMGADIPKQFLQIDNKAIIIHTIEKFIAFDPKIEIVLVLNESFSDFWKKAVSDAAFDYPVSIAKGGVTRFHSVKNGIEMVSGAGLIGVHDAVRPLISVDCIKRSYDTALRFGTAIPCIPLKESVRQINGRMSKPLDRSGIQLVQTPQVFKAEILRNSYNTDFTDQFTGDASVVEKAGFPINIVPGDEFNMKITTREDLEIATLLLTRQTHPLH